MKYTIFLFIILFPAFATGQAKTSVDSLAKIELNDLMDSWTLEMGAFQIVAIQ